jgi:hypothetical protein
MQVNSESIPLAGAVFRATYKFDAPIRAEQATNRMPKSAGQRMNQ